MEGILEKLPDAQRGESLDEKLRKRTDSCQWQKNGEMYLI